MYTYFHEELNGSYVKCVMSNIAAMGGVHVCKFVNGIIEVVSLCSAFEIHQCASVLHCNLVNSWTKPTDSTCYCHGTANFWPANSGKQ